MPSKKLKRKLKKPFSHKAKTPKAGITLELGSYGEFEALTELYASRQKEKLKSDLLISLQFWNWLNEVKPKPSAFIDWNEPLYRITYGGFNPLSIAGSLADGGRFNIGGAQQVDSSLFQEISKFGALYGADSVDCAKAEAGYPLGNVAIHKLIPKESLKLWDLKKVLDSLNYSGLEELINSTPTSAIWGLQKSPLVSQLLASYLRSLDGQGILFPSTKKPDSKVVAVFLKDDSESNRYFSTSVI